MKALIIEDELPAYRRLQKLLEEVYPSLEVLDVIDSVEESIAWLTTNPSPDLLFMDVHLSDGISFEIIEQTNLDIPVIFTTAYDEYAIKAFKNNGVDYLLKPIISEDLKNAIEKVAKQNGGKALESPSQLKNLLGEFLPQLQNQVKESRFLIKRGSKMFSLTTDKIAYFFVDDGLCYLVTHHGEKYVIDQNLNQLEEQLNNTIFFRANRAYLVRYEAVKTVHNYFKGKLKVDLVPGTQEDVLISREKATQFKQWLDLR